MFILIIIGNYGDLKRSMIDIAKNVKLIISRPQDLWDNWETKRNFFDWFAEEFNISLIEDWYSVNLHNYSKFEGPNEIPVTVRILNTIYSDYRYNKVLPIVYPHTNWQPWRFRTSSKDFWNQKYA
jgi:hypothetical protein